MARRESDWYSLNFRRQDDDSVASLELDQNVVVQPPYQQTLVERPSTRFLTKSVYKGTWDEIDRMTGHGVYKFPHGVQFSGTFEDGRFRQGSYHFPMSQEIDRNGDGTEIVIKFADGLMYTENFPYCTPEDRRYYMTVKYGFRPPGKERETDSKEDRFIPPGCYDTGDGFYDPKRKCVLSAYHMNEVVRIPTATEEKWITDNCRKGWDEPVGYKPNLYEVWTTGRRKPEPVEEESFQGEEDSSSYLEK